MLGSNLGATLEPGEPTTVFGGLPVSRSVWWSWTAPFRGVTYLTAQQSSVNGVISVYTGSSVSQLTAMMNSNGDDYSGFQAEAGVTYQIRIASLGGLEGNLILTLQHLAPPANDHFTNRQELAGTPSSFAVWNAGATKETGEPQYSPPSAGRSVWYRWTAPTNGRLILQSDAYLGTLPIIGVYTGATLASLQRIGVSDASGQVRCDVTAGMTYQVMIDRQYNEGSTFICKLSFSTVTILSPTTGSVFQAPTDITIEAGTTSYDGVLSGVEFFADGQSLGVDSTAPYQFVWQQPNPGMHTLFARTVELNGAKFDSPTVSLEVSPSRPVNDSFTNALILSGDRNEFDVDNFHATGEPGEPQHTPFGLGHSLWWSWTAPLSGQLLVTAVQTSTPPIIVGPDPVGAFPCVGAYAGDSMNGLITVTNWADFKAMPLQFPVTQGVTYRFAWDSYVTTPEAYRVTQIAFAAIPNDHFTNRTVLLGTNIVVDGTTQIATREAGETGEGLASVWYSWTAPVRGLLQPSVSGSGAGLPVLLFTGTAVSNLVSVPLVNAPGGGVEAHVQAGQVCAVRVAAPGGAVTGPFQLRLNFLPVPVNDHFTNATVLAGLPVGASGNTRLATAESNEPNHAQSDYRQTIWWRWTAPSSGRVAVQATAAFLPAVMIYTGNSLTSLAPVGGSTFSHHPRVFNAVAGQAYRIVVAAPDYGAGDVVLDIFGVPANDAFSNRILLNGVTNAIAGNNATATQEGGEPTLASAAIGRTLWYSWVAPESGSLALSVEGAFPPQVGVFTGNSVGSLTRLTNGFFYSPEYGPFYGSLPVTNGGTYHFAVDGTHIQPVGGTSYDAFGEFNLTYEFTTLRIMSPTNGTEFPEGAPVAVQISSPNPTLDGVVSEVALVASGTLPGQAQILSNSPPSTILSNLPPGHYSLSVVATNSQERILAATPVFFVIRPLNDDFVNRIPFNGAPTNVSGSIFGSSLEAGESSRWENGIGGSVWWSWTAPATGRFAIVANRSTRVFTGTAMASLSLIAGATNGYVVFNAVAGQVYQIGCGGNTASPFPGDGPATLAIHAPPVNDAFDQRTPILTNRATVPFNTYAASRQAGEPNHGAAPGGGSVWYTWTAPVDGKLLLQCWSFNFSCAMGVYTGSVVNGLTTVSNSNLQLAPLQIAARAGVTYPIAIESSNATEGELQLQFLPTSVNDFFTNRIPAFGESVLLQGNNHDATRESGEPVLTGPGLQFAPQATLWWEWIAPQTGLVKLTSRHSEIALGGIIWRGTELATLNPVYRLQLTNDQSLSLLLPVQAGETFPISLGSLGEERGALGLEITYVTPPPNDNFASRQPLSGSSLTATGTVTGASIEAGEPSSTGPSVWYSWVSPMRGRATVTVNADCVTYKGTNLTELTPLVTATSGKAGFRAEAGQEYQFGVSSPLLRDFALTLDVIDSPDNDDWVDRIPLSGGSALIPLSMSGSTSEALGYLASEDDGDLWWVWLAPWSGKARVICPGATVIELYFGDAPGFSTATGWNGELEFQAFAGRWHWLRVQGTQSLETAMSLSLVSPPPIVIQSGMDQSTGDFYLNLNGLPRQVVAVYASDDLVTWQSVGQQMFVGNSLCFFDSPDRPTRFFKIVPLQ